MWVNVIRYKFGLKIFIIEINLILIVCYNNINIWSFLYLINYYVLLLSLYNSARYQIHITLDGRLINK